MKYITEDIGLKVASALLLHQGEASVKDIRAMPFFRSLDESEAVIKLLQITFDVEIYTKKVATWPIPQWEQLIRLKKHSTLQDRGIVNTF